MSGIICAIRGGPDSQSTIHKAIELAKKTNLPLYFLYVVDLDFLALTSSSRTRTISKNMHQMGEFILLTAQAEAETHGIMAESVVRHGNVKEEIIGLSHELDVKYVVLGRPRGQREENVFTHERLSRFGQQIETDSGATVVWADGNDT